MDNISTVSLPVLLRQGPPTGKAFHPTQAQGTIAELCGLCCEMLQGVSTTIHVKFLPSEPAATVYAQMYCCFLPLFPLDKETLIQT